MAVSAKRVRAILGGPLSKMTGLPVTPKLLLKVGKCLTDALAEESKKYFGKRGWSGGDPDGGPPIWDSFSVRLRGRSTLEITSSFYGMNELARGDIPERKMTWLTQEAKDRQPSKYKLTDQEKRLGMKQTGRVSKGTRLPLIVPIMTDGGTVELRRAPLQLGNAWIHPGIAKFTFFETAVRKWKARCGQIIVDEFIRIATGGKP